MPSPNQSTPASISFSLLRSRFDRFISRVFNERFVPAIRLRPPKLQLSIPLWATPRSQIGSQLLN
jgi:hypothetical protein